MRRLALLVILAPAAVGAEALATPVTLDGTEFDVVYDPATLGLFNTPVLVGNVVYFTPTAFTATSDNGQGLITTASSATIQLIANPGYEFTTMQVAAQGDYQMSGTGSYVNVTGGIVAASQGANQTTAALNLNGSLPLTLNDGQIHNWAGSAMILSGTPNDAGNGTLLPTTSEVDLTLSSTLMAYTQPGGSGMQQAFIQEKFGGLQLYVDPTPVPVPPALWLLVSGFMLLALMRVRHPEHCGAF